MIPLMTLQASVNIPTWRRKDLLQRLLLALGEQTMDSRAFEILVCDSGSGDGTREMIVSLQNAIPNLRWIDIATNTLSAKRNALASASHAPVLIMLDDDTVPVSTFVESHVRAHSQTEKLLFCGEIRYPKEWVSSSNYYRFRDSRHLGPTSDASIRVDIPVKFWSVMNCSLKPAEVLPYGLMDERFVRYGGEDHEFASRLARNGFRARFVDGARVDHWEAHGTVDQYVKKMYLNARYGVPMVAQLEPQFIEGSKYRWLESDLAKRTLTSWAINRAARAIATPTVLRAAVGVARRTDKIRWAYLSPLYRLIGVAAHLQGVRDRRDPDSGGWFE
jgi:GT2 family glycosyltransferase